MQTSNANSQCNTLSSSPAHHCLRALTPMSRAFFSAVHFLSSLLLMVSLFSLPTLAQVDCVNPGGIGIVMATVNNPAGPSAGGPQSFTATLPVGGGHTILAGYCTATIDGVANGTCTVAPDGQSVTWNGDILNNQTLTITYRVQVAASAANGSNVVINNTTTVAVAPNDLIFPATSNLFIGCTTPVIPSARVSDQKPGSVLVYPYYVSNAAGTNDTRISLTHSSAPGARVYDAYVHIFLVQGDNCAQADFFVCLTRGASFTFTAFDMDPMVEGYIIAVAVDGATGLPVQNNVLIGNAFVNAGDYSGNYGAESFAANSASTGLYSDNGTTATLFFDGIGYDAVPKEFAVEIQSPHDAVGQKIVVAGMIGDLSTGTLSGALQVTSGQVVNDVEIARSATGIVSGGCQAIGIITLTRPRVPGGLGNLIPSMSSGTIKFKVGGAVGLLMTPNTEDWHGIRTLHKTATVATSLTMPVFVPTCPAL